MPLMDPRQELKHIREKRSNSLRVRCVLLAKLHDAPGQSTGHSNRFTTAPTL